MKWTRNLWIIALICPLPLSACGKNGPVNCPPLRVGVVISQDGSQGGLEQKRGYEIALQEINSAGGINGCPLELVYEAEGDANEPDTAQIAVLNLADQGVLAIVGATSNTASMSIAAIGKYFEVPVIVPSETGDDITSDENPWAFALSAPEKSMADVSFDMLVDRMGLDTNVAIVYEQSEYGQSMAVSSGRSAMERGLQVVAYEGYSLDAEDYSALLEKLKTAEPAAVFVISSQAEQAQALVEALRDEELNLTVLIGAGTGFTQQNFLYDDQGAIRTDMNNLFIATPWALDQNPDGLAAFVTELDAYRQTTEPDNLCEPVQRTVDAYTAIRVAADAIAKASSQEDWLKKLNETENLAGFREALALELHSWKATFHSTLTGPVEFETNGQNKREALLTQFINGELITVYPPDVAKRSPVLTSGW